jgi:hypothetical protein
MAPCMTASRTSPADCSRDAPGNCDERAPNASVPAADVRAVVPFVCARAHRASAPRGRAADPGPSRVPLSRQGGTRASQLERAEDGPTTRRTARHPWRAARRTSSAMPSQGTSRLPSPWASTPTSFNATRRPRLGQVAPSWRVAVGGAGRCGPLTPSCQPTRPAVAATPRAVGAVPPRPLLPNPERCGGVTEPSGRRVPHPPSGRSPNQGGAPSPPNTARRPAGSSRRGAQGPARGAPHLAAPTGPRMAPPSCASSIRLPAHPFARGARAARSHSVRRATVVSPPRGGRCPCIRRRLRQALDGAQHRAHTQTDARRCGADGDSRRARRGLAGDLAGRQAGAASRASAERRRSAGMTWVAKSSMLLTVR